MTEMLRARKEGNVVQKSAAAACSQAAIFGQGKHL